MTIDYFQERSTVDHVQDLPNDERIFDINSSKKMYSTWNQYDKPENQNTNTDGHILAFYPYNKDALMNLSHDFLLFGLY